MKKKATQIIELQQSDFLAEMHCFASFLKQQLENKIDKEESSHFYHTILSESIYELHKMLRKYKIFDDAVHIAMSTVNKIDVLVSWNFKHIVNLNRIHLFNSVNIKEGYNLLEIRSPMELLNE